MLSLRVKGMNPVAQVIHVHLHQAQQQRQS